MTRRLFADSASWNRKAFDLGRAVGYETYPTRLLTYGYGKDPSARGKLQIKLADYSVPIWDRAQATTMAECFQLPWAQQKMTFGNLPIGSYIPWNPAWRGGSGVDGCLSIVDWRTGEAWHLWGCTGGNCFDWFGPNWWAGYLSDPEPKLCLGTLNYQRNIFAATDAPRPADWPKDQPWFATVNARGMGIDKAALVVRADEVAEGVIRHAVPFTIGAPMFGPLANPQVGNTGPGAGTTRGFYCRPGTKLEWAAMNPYGPSTDVERRNTIPSGMRFALDITDGEIEGWLDRRGYLGARRSTARIFAVALRDYGWIIAETGAWGIGIETDGIYNPQSAGVWKNLGMNITVDPMAPYNNPTGDLLYGLLESGRVYVVAAP